MTKIKEIAFTGYPVTDLNRARAFYEEVLGLAVSREFGENGRMWIEYDVGASTLAITNITPEWKPSSDGPSVAFEVEDFDQSVADIRASGARFTVEPMSTGVCRLAVVLDPDGNSLALHKRDAHNIP